MDHRLVAWPSATSSSFYSPSPSSHCLLDFRSLTSVLSSLSSSSFSSSSSDLFSSSSWGSLSSSSSSSFSSSSWSSSRWRHHNLSSTSIASTCSSIHSNGCSGEASLYGPNQIRMLRSADLATISLHPGQNVTEGQTGHPCLVLSEGDDDKIYEVLVITSLGGVDASTKYESKPLLMSQIVPIFPAVAHLGQPRVVHLRGGQLPKTSYIRLTKARVHESLLEPFTSSHGPKILALEGDDFEYVKAQAVVPKRDLFGNANARIKAKPSAPAKPQPRPPKQMDWREIGNLPTTSQQRPVGSATWWLMTQSMLNLSCKDISHRWRRPYSGI